MAAISETVHIAAFVPSQLLFCVLQENIGQNFHATLFLAEKKLFAFKLRLSVCITF